jgi:hypothetical protein
LCHQQFTAIISAVVRKRNGTARPLRAGKRRRGRPFVHTDAWSKVSVVLFNRQVARLDAAVDTVRRKTSTSINRAAVIRALIDGVLDSGFDLTTAISERDLRLRLSRRLR